MPDLPAPDGISWIVWLVAIIATPLLGAAASVIVALITRRDTKADIAEVRDHQAAIKAGVDQSLEQVQNTHSTNLRDDVDDLARTIRDGLAAIRDDLGGLHSETRDLRQDVQGIRADARRDRRELTAARKSIDDHLSEVPRLVEEAVTAHVHACPLRTEGKTTP